MLAEGLQSVVGESVETGGLKKIQRVLRRHLRVAIVDVAQERAERLLGWRDVTDLNLKE